MLTPSIKIVWCIFFSIYDNKYKMSPPRFLLQNQIMICWVMKYFACGLMFCWMWIIYTARKWKNVMLAASFPQKLWKTVFHINWSKWQSSSLKSESCHCVALEFCHHNLQCCRWWWSWHHNNSHFSVTLKTKGRQFDNFVVTGGTVSCRNDNLTVPPVMTKLSNWWSFVFSVMVMQSMWPPLTF